MAGLMDMMAGLGNMQAMAGPAMQEISSIKALFVEMTRLQRETLETQKEILACLAQSKTPERSNRELARLQSEQ